MGFLKRLFCSHQWKVLTEHKLDSPFEQLAASGARTKEITTYPPFYMKKATTVMVCDKCGTTKVVRTQNCTRWD